FSAAFTEFAGWHCPSSICNCTCRPLMPPCALRCATASFAPLTYACPLYATEPVKGWITPILTGPAPSAATAAQLTSINPLIPDVRYFIKHSNIDGWRLRENAFPDLI